ncbi:cobalt-precorrin-5B (C(1))-methyltransferase [Solihabitans fulvus]|uniref:Cobalt-precorrin-5B C(1)-methyltransferase n=1 Tax=Solihabitans fulvus TaxID=1892852 RepID=A0A5B2X677_9PSEU|nr:cobalt-precorrin-5B (C(1))-methyltransferase [Solihabitans fulvus]
MREPDLPRTAKVRPQALRTGFTTGACSAAAAKAAVLALRDRAAPSSVEIEFPSGNRHVFAVHSCTLDADSATAVVVKDAGDDPDVTHGAHLTATARWRADHTVVLGGGEGVGVVTKPGLGLDVGGPAINPVPRQMITAAVREAAPDRGVDVTISVPGGEKMAYKTTNRRLGIMGGISILGTTGIVRPFSTASWRASVEQAVSVMAAQSCPTLVLATGGRTERAAMTLLPHLPEVAFVEVGDFTGAALRRAVEHGIPEVVFVGMIGKLTKLASGVLMTHYTKSKVDTDLLARITSAHGGDPADAAEIGGAVTARRAYEVWDGAGLLRECGDDLCARVAEVLARFSAECGRRLPAKVAMVDFPATAVVAATEPEWVTGPDGFAGPGGATP